MALIRTLDTGATGLLSNDNAMSVTANNLANTNTVGYKAGDVRFEDLIYQRLAGTYFPSDLGSGVRMAGISSDFGQGTLLDSLNPLDMAIDGGGLFVVKDGQNVYYSRSGQFGTDADGFIINSWGQKLQGYKLDPKTGIATGPLTDIQIRNDLQDPKKTSVVKMNVNLDSKMAAHAKNPSMMLNFMSQMGQAAASGDIAALRSVIEANINSFPSEFRQRLLMDLAMGDVSQLSADVVSYFANSYGDFSTQVTLIDSQGEDHLVDVYFTKLSDSTMFGTQGTSPGSTWLAWTAYNGKIPGGENVRLIGNVQCLVFDRTGELRDQITYLPGRYIFDDGSINPQNLLLDFGIDTGVWNQKRRQVGIPKDPYLGPTTQQSSPFNVNMLWQDGMRAQHYMEINMELDGKLFGLNADGSTTYLCQVALAEFTNPGGLHRVGKNNFIESNVSGTALVGKPRAGQRGSVIIRTLEQSNVDITQEFVDMIKTQRFYQANAESIRTADQMFQVLTGLRR